jgi:hypothetical protein
MKKYTIIFCLVMSLDLFSACSDYTQPSNDDIASACTAVVSCLGIPSYEEENISACIDRVKAFANDPNLLAENSWAMIFTESEMIISQNIDCLVTAKSDCSKIRACLNGNSSDTDCTDWGEDKCIDDSTISSCIKFTSFDQQETLTKVVFDCAAYGLKCSELKVGYASCVNQVGLAEDLNEMKVTCDGDLAKIHYGTSMLSYNCGISEMSCQPGENYGSKLGERPFCILEVEECSDDHCVGNVLVECGQESVEFKIDCSVLGQECIGSSPYCGYTEECKADDYADNCQQGVITYCGPDGISQISCSDLGYADCQSNGNQVACVR